MKTREFGLEARSVHRNPDHPQISLLATNTSFPSSLYAWTNHHMSSSHRPQDWAGWSHSCKIAPCFGRRDFLPPRSFSSVPTWIPRCPSGNLLTGPRCERAGTSSPCGVSSSKCCLLAMRSTCPWAILNTHPPRSWAIDSYLRPPMAAAQTLDAFSMPCVLQNCLMHLPCALRGSPPLCSPLPETWHSLPSNVFFIVDTRHPVFPVVNLSARAQDPHEIR